MWNVDTSVWLKHQPLRVFRLVFSRPTLWSANMNASSAAQIFGNRREAWELREYAAPAAAGDDASDIDQELIDEMTPEECSAEFMNMLIHLKHPGIMSAKHACALSFLGEERRSV